MIKTSDDSGLLHLARAVGTKAVQIYGGSHPTFGFALSKEEGIYLLKDLDLSTLRLTWKRKVQAGRLSLPMPADRTRDGF